MEHDGGVVYYIPGFRQTADRIAVGVRANQRLVDLADNVIVGVTCGNLGRIQGGEQNALADLQRTAADDAAFIGGSSDGGGFRVARFFGGLSRRRFGLGATGCHGQYHDQCK